LDARFALSPDLHGLRSGAATRRCREFDQQFTIVEFEASGVAEQLECTVVQMLGG
jgi:hypothetical protein